MKSKHTAMIIVVIVISSCTSSFVECDVNSSIYQDLLANHETWVEQLYNMGEAPIGGRSFLYAEGVVVYALKSDGVPIQFSDWNSSDKMLLIMIGPTTRLDRELIGTIGSQGLIYTSSGNLESIFPDYEVSSLPNDIYCVRYNPDS